MRFLKLIYSREDRSECGFRSIMTAESGVRKCASSFELAQIRSDFVVDGCSVIFFLPVFSSPFRCADQTYRRSAAALLIHVIDFSIFFIKSKHGNRIAVLIRGKDYVPAEAEIPGRLSPRPGPPGEREKSGTGVHRKHRDAGVPAVGSAEKTSVAG